MPPRKWQIGDLLRVSADYLRKKGIENPRLNAEVLLAHQLRLERIRLYLNFDRPLNNREVSGFRSLIRRRIESEPLQYITGTQEFWSLGFSVDPSVLIPRPETEIAVEQVVKLAKGTEREGTNYLKILDLGTGCGAISVALATELPEAVIWATDISEAALSVARRNAVTHQVLERIRFLEGDLWEPLSNEDVPFDMVVSNPPYVTSGEFHALAPEVRDHEPRLALDGGQDGMYYLKKIVRGAHDYIRSGGWLILEMAPVHTEKILKMMEKMGHYQKMARIRDYSRSYRVAIAQTL